MRRMMDKMGLDMQEMPNVREVLIRTDKKEIILSKPEVTEMKSKDKSIFTITSDGYEEKELDVPIFSDEDNLVCQQSGTDKEKAINAPSDSVRRLLLFPCQYLIDGRQDQCPHQRILEHLVLSPHNHQR